MENETLPLPRPRCLTKDQAAAYLGVGVTLLTELQVPSVKFHKRIVYDVVDLDAWLEDYKRRGRAGKEVEWPVKPESTGVVTLDAGGLQQRYRTAAAYASVLGLKTEIKP